MQKKDVIHAHQIIKDYIRMNEPKTYNDYIVRSILINNEFGITEIKSIEDLIYMTLIREDYPGIVELIKSKDIDAIKRLTPPSITTSEYLSIMKITDVQDKQYIVTGYDSDELSQDPQVIDIFPM